MSWWINTDWESRAKKLAAIAEIKGQGAEYQEALKVLEGIENQQSGGVGLPPRLFHFLLNFSIGIGLISLGLWLNPPLREYFFDLVGQADRWMKHEQEQIKPYGIPKVPIQQYPQEQPQAIPDQYPSVTPNGVDSLEYRP